MSLSSKKKVKYLCISDIHLGHSRNPTKDIVNNLHQYFDHYSHKSIFANVDIIFIVGDLFDQLIDVSAPSLYEALEFITRLINFCEHNKIKLRILEGTPSHDRQQAKIIDAVTNMKGTKADVKWIKTLMVERMEDLDLSILYIPDEYTSSTKITLEMVKSLFKELHIDQVDIAQMHGMFHYQMCNIPGRHDTHDESEYLSLVRHFINIGHIHTYSHYQRILAQGSFDRLAHGEEEPKGGLLMTIRDEETDHYEFIANKHAKIFKTIEIKSSNLDTALAQIDREVKKVPHESYIRIKAPKLHAVFMAFPEIKKKYPFLIFSKLSTEDETSHIQATIQDNGYTVIEIRQENVIDLILNELPSVVDNERKRLEGLLSELQTT